ncbi:recombinase family protein [Actinomadura sediminis]|uniref:Recombinase family protein n=1 Tax=Actinomadura sediminis TaxID=1038904 RepID=A0ABW3EGT9_9ACTN
MSTVTASQLLPQKAITNEGSPPDGLPQDAPRVLLSIRLSVLTDETTSPERQESEMRSYAAARGWKIVGVASDLNVSATKVAPWNRKHLGEWIRDRAPEFDIILSFKLDRLVRQNIDLHQMIEWCKKFQKNLAAVHDPIDLSSPHGEALASLIASMARIEAANMGIRLTSLWDHSRGVADRWLVGRPPYGYTTVEGDVGKILVIDHEKARVLRWIYHKLKQGKSYYYMKQILERAGVPNPTGGKKWHPSTIARLLKNPSLRGIKTHGNNKRGAQPPTPILNENGQTVRIADPTFTDEEHEEILRLCSRREGIGKNKRESRSKFQGIIKCPGCSRDLIYRHNKRKLADGTYKEHNYLRCNRYLGDPCDAPGLPNADGVYESLVATATEKIGDLKVAYRRYARGATKNLPPLSCEQASITSESARDH